jgi:hypothetical protein
MPTISTKLATMISTIVKPSSRLPARVMPMSSAGGCAGPAYERFTGARADE